MRTAGACVHHRGWSEWVFIVNPQNASVRLRYAADIPYRVMPVDDRNELAFGQDGVDISPDFLSLQHTYDNLRNEPK